MYVLQWKQPAIDANKASPINVPVASVVANASSLRFTGKGAANYGLIQQENLMRLLENFADGTPPPFPTVGQTWYDYTAGVLNVCKQVLPSIVWEPVGGAGGVVISPTPPGSPSLGDLWVETVGSVTARLYIYTGVGRHPQPLGSYTIGGWEQIYPTVEYAGGREEYNAMQLLVDRFVGIPGSTQGNNAYRGLEYAYSSLYNLDGPIASAWQAATPRDPNFAPVATPALAQAEPTSYDWDRLLASARWALDRLDLPTGYIDSISRFPFTQDGRSADALLRLLPTNDVRYPTANRLTTRRLGSISLARAYAETMNALQNALPFRYTVKGITGVSGNQPNLSADTAEYLWCSHSQNYTGGPEAFLTLLINFPFDYVQLVDFIYGGCAIDVIFNYTPPGSPSAVELELEATCNQYNRFRMTAEQTHLFSAGLPLTLSNASTARGFLYNGVTGSDELIYSVGTSNVELVLNKSVNVDFPGLGGNNWIRLSARVRVPGHTIGGTLQIQHRIIRDARQIPATYPTGGEDYFGRPLPFTAGTDIAASVGVWNVSALPAPPVANFSANVTTGVGSITPTFTYTGTGSPSLIEWDLDGDGVYEATGATASTTYTSFGSSPNVEPRSYTVRVRATNGGGYDVKTAVSYITVT